MSNILKILVITAPVLALIFYYVILKQQEHDVQMIKDDLKFELEWNEIKATSPWFAKDRDILRERARKAEEKAREIENEEKRRKEKIEKFEFELEKTLNETQPRR